jgi:segregation and condensation protein A
MEHLSMMTTMTAIEPVALPEAPSSIIGAGSGFVVELEAFSGPLDLLLHLLREEQLEIADIPIARIADQFLQAVHELGLNQAADYLDMASRLVRLKAQMLLPRNMEEDGWEDPRAELVRRLLEYQQIREVAVWLGRAAERRAEQFARGYMPPAPALPPPPLTLNLLDMLTAVERVIAGIPSPVLHRVIARPLDVESATRRIEDLLRDQEQIRWMDALGSGATIVDVLSTLLALLELAKRGSLRLLQPTPFSPLVIARESARATT